MNEVQATRPSWAPFFVAAKNAKPLAPRPMETPEGIADRIRAAAFAELQAIHAFQWAADKFKGDAPESLIQGWLALVPEERKHLNWLLERAQQLGIDIAGREVSDHLWDSFMRCRSAQEFAVYMASAEDRGRQAGERFEAGLTKTDPITAQIFGQIAREELAHVQLCVRHYPEAAAQRGLKLLS